MLKKVNLRSAVIAGGLMAVLAAPVALGAGERKPVDGGTRNPTLNPSQTYTRETEIIANTSTYGTRQSNKSDNGGGAIYGCRSGAGGSAAKNEPCIRAVNLNVGYAFEFQSGGALGGIITVGKGGDETKPFTTNATGVATGLNADRVDGVDGADLVKKSDAAAFAQAGDLLFAAVGADGSVTASRGGETTAAVTGDTFTVTFAKDVSKCSFTATASTATATPVILSAASAGGRQVTVDQVLADGSAGGALVTPPVPFHLQVVC